jgi:hypothetical protein
LFSNVLNSESQINKLKDTPSEWILPNYEWNHSSLILLKGWIPCEKKKYMYAVKLCNTVSFAKNGFCHNLSFSLLFLTGCSLAKPLA